LPLSMPTLSSWGTARSVGGLHGSGSAQGGRSSRPGRGSTPCRRRPPTFSYLIGSRSTLVSPTGTADRLAERQWSRHLVGDRPIDLEVDLCGRRGVRTIRPTHAAGARLCLHVEVHWYRRRVRRGQCGPGLAIEGVDELPRRPFDADGVPLREVCL